MKSIAKIAALALLVAVPTAPAVAGWKLVPPNAETAVAKSMLKVRAQEPWNRNSFHPIKKGELWTLDGLGLNELYFVSALAPGETLYRVTDKKNPPPAMGKTLQLTDIPEFFESSQRVVLNTSVFETKNVEPVTFLGGKGVRFTYEYAVQASPLKRRGVATAGLVNGQLYLISFTAPAITFYERDKAKAIAIMDSARL